MTKADDVLRKCLSGKKLNVDKWSKNKEDNDVKVNDKTFAYCKKHKQHMEVGYPSGEWECSKCEKEFQKKQPL